MPLSVGVLDLQLQLAREGLDHRSAELEREGILRPLFDRLDEAAEQIGDGGDLQGGGQAGHGPDQGGIAVGVELLEQPDGDEQGGGLVTVELKGGEPGALAELVPAVDRYDVQADVVAELADVALGGADVDLEGLGELGGGEAHPGVAQAVEEVDHPDELVAGRVAGSGGHGARSLPLRRREWWPGRRRIDGEVLSAHALGAGSGPIQKKSGCTALSPAWSTSM